VFLASPLLGTATLFETLPLRPRGRLLALLFGALVGLDPLPLMTRSSLLLGLGRVGQDDAGSRGILRGYPWFVG
jgi:hypothetical protein